MNEIIHLVDRKCRNSELWLKYTYDILIYTRSEI